MELKETVWIVSVEIDLHNPIIKGVFRERPDADKRLEELQESKTFKDINARFYLTRYLVQ